MPSSIPTVRSLARELGLSPTTVSEALRGSARVNAGTVRRVQDAARRAGYRRNPLAGSVMAELRRSRTATIHGTIALVDSLELRRPQPKSRFRQEQIRGIGERAAELGFQVDVFTVGQNGLTVTRLAAILHTRGILGALLLPVWDEPDFRPLPWKELAGVYLDYSIVQPPLNCVCCDHTRSMHLLLRQLQERGYRRPGLFVHRHRNTRLHHCWEGAFRTFVAHTPGLEAVEPLAGDETSREAFLRWLQAERPDVVIGHDPVVIKWIQEAGRRVPADCGFASLNLHLHATPCAGLDQQQALLAHRAVELVVAQLHRNERGAPTTPAMTSLPARWVDGPTVRGPVRTVRQ